MKCQADTGAWDSDTTDLYQGMSDEYPLVLHIYMLYTKLLVFFCFPQSLPVNLYLFDLMLSLSHVQVLIPMGDHVCLCAL